MQGFQSHLAQFPTPTPNPSPRTVTRYGWAGRESDPFSTERKFTPISSLYTLSSRPCENDDLSSFIVQSDLIKKDRRLAWQQHDIDDCNGLVLEYVERGVRENDSYYLRRKLVETFGQTNHTVLINRLRLVAVLLGGERGTGGMDPVFRPIREEAHRISPYVLVLIQNYITALEEKMNRVKIDQRVDKNFKDFVDSLGDSFQSEYGIADIGARNRNKPALELYALRVLLRDLKEYYGVREEGQTDAQSYNVIFSDPGTFTSDTLATLKRNHSSMSPGERASNFIKLGLELREHLSQSRESRTPLRWYGDDDEINHLKKLNEIAAASTGLFAAARVKQDPIAQARTLVDLLFLEGLYSKKDRKNLLKELSVKPKLGAELGAEHPQETQAFYRFLGYMHGLAYATMDEMLGDAARAYSSRTPEAEHYIEAQARKSALQVLGQLQQEVFKQHKSILAGKRDIHLAGKAQGRLKVFRSESEIAAFLRKDSLNGAETIWVLKSGLNMPNEASFAAIILEDPIMKASHYDGYARSRIPPIPLLQVPEASEFYATFDGKNVLLEASRVPDEKVEITLSDNVAGKASPVKKNIQLSQNAGRPQLIEINSPKSNQEIRDMQKQVGAKAANYAFLRSALPLDRAKNEEHIYPGFAIPFYFYERHLAASGANEIVASLKNVKDPESVNRFLFAIRDQILNAPVDTALLSLFQTQMEDRLSTQHTIPEEAVKLRFRSSSNAEDNKDFSGAGLYESHFAYYAYGVGPAADRSRHKVNQNNVAAAIKRVWASLWKAEAYRAREQAGIAQETVRMGILVHPSYRKEESTGVVFHYAPDDIEIVVNKGNENVQNPGIAGLTPEMHRITDQSQSIDFSSRYALSEDVILSARDQQQLMELLNGVIPKFKALYPDQGIAGVDVEFKVLEVPDPEGGEGNEKDVVMLKQIRPLAKRAGKD